LAYFSKWCAASEIWFTNDKRNAIRKFDENYRNW
jgi:hypothetical protein